MPSTWGIRGVMAGCALLLWASACSESTAPPEPSPAEEKAAEAAGSGRDDALIEVLRASARQVLGALPAEAASSENPITPAKIQLGRMLYYDERLSKNHDFSCNSCHLLDQFGVDHTPTSEGHHKQRGDRNSPTVYNAALHIAQFWDGRAADVEEQAKGPVLNPIEMAMPSEGAVLDVLRSVPGYGPLFRAAFPGEADPITYDNMARAIGAFERRLITPSPFDAFLEGETEEVGDEALAGLETFLSVGCLTCHAGPLVGGAMFQKLGLVHEYPTEDLGRFAVTGNEADRQVFKVPSLRNVRETAPYFHDGSIARLEEAVRLMGYHQVGRTLTDDEIATIVAFLDSLTGTIDPEYIQRPPLPASGPETPPPDPS